MYTLEVPELDILHYYMLGMYILPLPEFVKLHYTVGLTCVYCSYLNLTGLQVLLD